MTLDLVLPTYNRADLLRRSLDSVIESDPVPELGIEVYVVDNNSKDNTAQTVREYQQRLRQPLHYLLETQQGYSAALNAGIRAGSGDIVGIINDDERIDRKWFRVLYDFFQNPEMSFAGGPYYPDWSAEKPVWVSKEMGGIIGWVDAGEHRREYGPGFGGMLMGGNAAIRRSVFEVVGLYETSLGRTGEGADSCEDDDMFARLLERKFRGMYLPELIIYHHIPQSRLTRKYFRKWAFAQGRSLARLGSIRKSEVATVLGIPRWRFRHAALGGIKAVKGLAGMEPPHVAFEGELRTWTLLGYLNRALFKH